MKATRTNQSVSIGSSGGADDGVVLGRRSRSAPDLALQEEDEGEREDRVHPHVAEEREPRAAGGDVARIAFARAEQSIDEPRLATQLRCEPAGEVRDVRERQ